MRKFLAIANLVALLAHAGLSYYTQSDVFDKSNVGDVSDQYNSLFTPAGQTFAIWGLIYLSLLAFCIRHIYTAFNRTDDHEGNWELDRIGPWFIINNLATIGWLFTWTSNMISAATVLIFVQLITLAIIHLRLGIFRRRASLGSKAFTQFPLSIYFGWITIATIANTSIYLVANGWADGGLDYTPVSWTRIMIVVATVINGLVILSRKNLFFGLVFIWALYGIILKREAAAVEAEQPIIAAAWMAMGVTGVLCAVQLLFLLFRRR